MSRERRDTRPNWFLGLPVDAGGWYPERVSAPPPRVRLFDPADLHFTVAFLGAVDEAAARRAWGVAGERALGPLEISLGGTRALGSPRQPSALCALVEAGAEPLGDAIAALRDPCLAAAGLPPERRAPLPHLTFARIARQARSSERRDALRWLDGLSFAGVRLGLSALALYTWAEDRRERQFRVVERRPLTGA